ncbi:MAG: hypothetical protein ABSG93_12055 [Solirubrobacteraceae bacterium]|jgi:hypothetical protein
MTKRQQLRRLREWTSDLVRENSRLRRELSRREEQVRELSDANANLVIERDAADALLARQVSPETTL